MTEEQQVSVIKGKRDRSPGYPFIPLGTAVQRLEAFESYFGRHATPANRVAPAWGMKDGSSAADQTLAALRSYGLVDYNGTGPKREVSISEEGRRYLRAQQDSVKEAVLKQSALRPKTIRKFWALWGADRPRDPVAIDTLTLENGFSDTGAASFLAVYDATVAFAKLTMSDKLPNNETDQESDPEAQPEQQMNDVVTPIVTSQMPRKTATVAGERELKSGLLSKNTSFRLLVTGAVGAKELERLIMSLQLDKQILDEGDSE